MSQGKANAQSGHAYVNALLNALTSDCPKAKALAQSYATLKPGTKICLNGGSIFHIEKLIARLQASSIPHAVIVDSGHVELPDFDGSPVLTAVGIGPLTKEDTPNFIKKFKLWTGQTNLAGSSPLRRFSGAGSQSVTLRSTGEHNDQLNQNPGHQNHHRLSEHGNRQEKHGCLLHSGAWADEQGGLSRLPQ
jgi:PTH2 family peptidyl-tRNA hydrolase